jgi:hypothetical protein
MRLGRQHQAKSQSGNGFDHPGFPRAVTEGSAQFRNALGQDALGDFRARPDRVEQVAP